MENIYSQIDINAYVEIDPSKVFSVSTDYDEDELQ